MPKADKESAGSAPQELLNRIREEIAVDPAGASSYMILIDLCVRRVAEARIDEAKAQEQQALRDAIAAQGRARTAGELAGLLRRTQIKREDNLRNTPGAYADYIWDCAVVKPWEIPEGPPYPVTILMSQPACIKTQASYDESTVIAARIGREVPGVLSEAEIKDAAHALEILRWDNLPANSDREEVVRMNFAPDGYTPLGLTFLDPNHLNKDTLHIGERRVEALGQLVAAVTSPESLELKQF